MESTQLFNVPGVFANLIGQFKLPGVDAAVILESRRKDLEAVMVAVTTEIAGMQSLGQKQAEILRSAVSGLQSRIAPKATQEREQPVDRDDTIQQALHDTVADFRSLVDIACKTQFDSLAVLGKRVTENVEEWKGLLSVRK
ncbi:phasin family protein [Paraburkholderia rhizosphaerae]|uniref:Phasin family protein n=1 Tax=Paraburkholderia rhizosphaerae TaxID=480658 RepID=A0A4R8LJI2_9BURK|nr:phasin family protein [Paraburkholderia rhizosphaerae]TDY43942.1 hypothetical protein BX592_117144 [Paraburkholderia rhizosphaerae]